LAERSVGTPDPGAVSLGLIVTAIGEVLGGAEAVAAEATQSIDKEGQNL
jgi:dihydroxyacetone kinase